MANPRITITLDDICSVIANNVWQSYCQTAIRHSDKSESEIHTRPLATHGWDGVILWRVMYRAPHDKRQSRRHWPQQVVTACGFAHSKEDAAKDARAAVRAHTKSKEAAA